MNFIRAIYNSGLLMTLMMTTFVGLMQTNAAAPGQGKGEIDITSPHCEAYKQMNSLHSLLPCPLVYEKKHYENLVSEVQSLKALVKDGGSLPQCEALNIVSPVLALIEQWTEEARLGKYSEKAIIAKAAEVSSLKAELIRNLNTPECDAETEP